MALAHSPIPTPITTLRPRHGLGEGLGLVRLTTDQYHRLIDAGVIEDGAPIELLNGLLVYKHPNQTGDQYVGHSRSTGSPFGY
jgi:hypothetical protein